MCTECVLASRYLRNTLGGSHQAFDMMSGGSAHGLDVNSTRVVEGGPASIGVERNEP